MLMACCCASCWILHFMHYIILTLAHIQPFYALDQVHVEPESEVRAEQTQVEDLTNLALDQGKPWCIPPNIP
jgi:predicted adenine nucleotide alpha hydrolase (AANH) superfamily ATPase